VSLDALVCCIFSALFCSGVSEALGNCAKAAGGFSRRVNVSQSTCLDSIASGAQQGHRVCARTKPPAGSILFFSRNSVDVNSLILKQLEQTVQKLEGGMCFLSCQALCVAFMAFQFLCGSFLLLLWAKTIHFRRNYFNEDAHRSVAWIQNFRVFCELFKTFLFGMQII
jgi:hypothetical protein